MPKFGSPVAAQKCVLVANSTCNPSPGCIGSESLASDSVQLVSSIFSERTRLKNERGKHRELTSGLYTFSTFVFESSDGETLGLRLYSQVTFGAKLSSLAFAYYGSWHSRKASFLEMII